ncbi:hypothetical protein V8C37DRAFT_392098 [Trichoderma ceciliae]
MDDNTIALGGLNVIRDEEDNSPTQPFSSPGHLTISQDINPDIDDMIYNNGDADTIKGGDNESTVADESEENKDTTLIDSSYDIHRVTWKDPNGQAKQIYDPKHDLKLDIYMNTLTNRAMFKLHSYINLKGSRRKSNKQSVYLFLYPDRIQAIATQKSPITRSTASDTAMPNLSLHFSLTQKPDLIGPQGWPLASKGKTSTQLDLLQDLAIATKFTIHLASSHIIAPRQNDFELLAAVFSPINTKNRPFRDNKRGNLATLYAGNGGEVISANKAVVHNEASPPLYTSVTLGPRPVSNKRRRPDSDVDDDGLSVTHISPLAPNIYTLFDDLTCLIKSRFDNLERSVEELKTRFDNLEQEAKSHFDNLERSIVEVKDTIEELDTSHTLCRYDTEERDGIVQEVKEVCDDHDTAFKMASEDLFYDLEKDLGKECEQVIVQVRETCDEITNQYKDEVQEAQEDIHAIKTRLNALQNASVRFNGTMVLDI